MPSPSHTPTPAELAAHRRALMSGPYTERGRRYALAPPLRGLTVRLVSPGVVSYSMGALDGDLIEQRFTHQGAPVGISAGALYAMARRRADDARMEAYHAMRPCHACGHADPDSHGAPSYGRPDCWACPDCAPAAPEDDSWITGALEDAYSMGQDVEA